MEVNTPTDTWTSEMYMSHFYNSRRNYMNFQVNKLNRVMILQINNCRHFTANRQTATLTTQDIDQALSCCVKMVQQISDTRNEEAGTTGGCIHQFSEPITCSKSRKVFQQKEGNDSTQHFLIKQYMR
jgi:hypothetical protein